MKKRIIRIIILILVVLATFAFGRGIFPFDETTAYAVGDLTVNWGVSEGNPIFEVFNVAPGEDEERMVNIANGASTGRVVAVRGIETSQTGNLADVLSMIISVDGSDLYGGTSGAKTVTDFFSDSAGSNGIPLFNLPSSTSKDIKFKVAFDEGADNDYQNKSIVFDIKIGISFELPAECSQMEFSNIIFGTQGNDRLHGTNGNDLILGLEGNDRIYGSNGNDCEVGGAGNDVIFASNGTDVLVGGDGDDKLNGSNGDDKMFGGEGKDVIKGSNGNDYIEGGGGNDEIDGGNGNDMVDGGGGNDTMRGRNGNDTLIGAAGSDSARGDLGVDICDAEVRIKCE